MAKSSPFGKIPQLPPRPPAVVLDRMGHMVEKGHQILMNDPAGFVFEVTDLRPVLHPGIAPGQSVMQVMLTATFPVTLVAAQPTHGIVIVGESAARQAERAAQNGSGATVPDLTPVEEPIHSGIVLTDAPEPVSEPLEPVTDPPKPERGRCLACGEFGTIGVTCEQCGDGTYQPVF